MALSPRQDVSEAVILCGGLGSRLRSVVTDRPKALANVLGRPFLEWLILMLSQRHGIRRVILATGYLGSQIQSHFGSDRWCGVALGYSHEETPLGTGGALRLAAELATTSPMLVLNGDSYCRFDLSQLLEVHFDNRAVVTLWLGPSRGLTKNSYVPIDASGMVLDFDDEARAGSTLASAGVYLVERVATEAIPPQEASSLERDVFPSLVGKGLYAVAGDESFLDIGTPASLAAAEDVLAAELSGLACD